MSSLKNGVNLFRFCKSFKPFLELDNNIKPVLIHPRYLSTAVLKKKPKHQPVISKADILQFEKVFPEIHDDILNTEQFNSLSEISTRFSKSLRYNVPNGKKNRGLAVVTSYKSLEKAENLTDENIRLANILGWSVELLQSFFLVMDDLVDGSETRRGAPCWYKIDQIGLTAVNDGLLLESSVYLLLQKYFSHHQSYLHFLQLFLEVTRMTILGQIMDSDTVDVTEMTLKRFELIAYYKTGYYTFYLPVALAMYLSNITNQEVLRCAKTILLEIGKFFQMQDDFLDCFGDPKVTGKIGTDIETGKCTWLAGTAMEIASPSLKEIMRENYGKNDAECVKKVKSVYLELGIPKLFETYEEESYKKFQFDIQNLPKELPPDLFNKLVSMVYKRNS